MVNVISRSVGQTSTLGSSKIGSQSHNGSSINIVVVVNIIIFAKVNVMNWGRLSKAQIPLRRICDFHRNFPTGKVVDTNHESPRHKSCRQLS